jgi:hypothetical protein
MHNVTRNFAVTILVGVVSVAGLSGCATNARTVTSAEDLAAASMTGSETVVIGKFRLLRNGYEARLGNGFFATSAKLHVNRDGNPQEIVGEVGRDGQFVWILEPGNYRISSIAFDNRGDSVEPVTNFAFTVADGADATYIGTITMEATFESGYYGLSGTVDRYAVIDDCAADCDARLAALGLSRDRAVVSLAHQSGQFARAD